jgi:predicted O-methyltransferase YrrM
MRLAPGLRDFALGTPSSVVAGVATVSCLGLLLVLTAWLGPVAVLIGFASLLFAIAVDISLQLRRVRRAQDETYPQVESLFSMFSVLKITRPLPPLRGWAIAPDFANVLISEILDRRPECILEVGSGVSTLVAAYCLKQLGSGSIVSLDDDATFAATSRAHLRAHGLQDFASVLHAPLVNITIGKEDWLWYDTDPIKNLDQIDMVIVDGPSALTQKLARYPALPLLFGHLTAGAAIVLDDARRRDEREIVARWLREFDGFERQDLETMKGAVLLRRLPAGDRAARGSA